MKKLLLITMMLASVLFAKGQNYATLYVEEVENHEDYYYCDNQYDGVVLYGIPNCSNGPGSWTWRVNDYNYYTDTLLLTNDNEYYFVTYCCGYTEKQFSVWFEYYQNESPFSEPVINCCTYGLSEVQRF